MDKFTPLLAKEFSRREEHIENILRLLDEGNTVPFIARYRKEMHGTTDDQTIRAIADRLAYLRGLDERKAAVVSAIEAQGKLTDELSAAIENAQTLAEVEDIYRPYKQKRRTRATIAREKGLAPLAELLLSQTGTSGTLEALAAPYVNEEKGVMSTDDALAGAGDIIAETISDDAAIRAALRRLYRTRGVLWAKAATDEDSVYRLYYDYREPVSRVQGHRVLAVNRGEREGMLKAGVEIEDALALQEIRRAVFRGISISNAFVNACCEDAWRRLIEPSAEREIRGELTDAADEAAIRAFGQNLQPLLMQPPLRNRVTMGFDPAYRTGCKIAVVDETGKVLETGVVYPTPPHNRKDEARKTLTAMIRRHGVTAIAIGNGTASKESVMNMQCSVIQELFCGLHGRKRGGGERLFGVQARRGGISGLRCFAPLRGIHRAAFAGPARRARENRAEEHRCRAIPARYAPRAAGRNAPRRGGGLRKLRWRRSEHGVGAAPFLCCRAQRHGGEKYCRLPRGKRGVPVARRAQKGAAHRAEGV